MNGHSASVELLEGSPNERECLVTIDSSDKLKTKKATVSNLSWTALPVRNERNLVSYIWSVPITLISSWIFNFAVLIKQLILRMFPNFQMLCAPCEEWWRSQGITIYDAVESILMGFLLVTLYVNTRPASKFLYADAPAIADFHATLIHKIEAQLGIDCEEYIQSLFVDSVAWQRFFRWIYHHGHRKFTAIVYYGSMFVAASRKTKMWQIYFYSFNAALMISCLIYALFPLSPPRLASSSKTIDSFHVLLDVRTCDSVWQKDKKLHRRANCYAAMPSVHILTVLYTSGMACYHLFLFMAQYKGRGERGLKVIAGVAFAWFVFYVPLMHVTVVMSGHHWLMDAFGSYVVAGVTHYLVRKRVMATEPTK